VATESIADRGTVGESTRDVKADAAYCHTLALDFEMSARVVLDCLRDEPAKRAYKLCVWAETTSEVQAERERALKNYAKKHSLGIYRPDPDEELHEATKVKRGSAAPMAERQAAAKAFLSREDA
jgi:hypothetical protein